MTAADDVVHGHTNTRRRTRTRLDDRLATAVVVFFSLTPWKQTNQVTEEGGRKEETETDVVVRPLPHLILFRISSQAKKEECSSAASGSHSQCDKHSPPPKRRSQSISAGEMTFPRRFAGQQQQKERSFFFLLI